MYGDFGSTLSGGDADTLRGGTGNDMVGGGGGNDSLNGEAGNDTIWSGAGADTIRGLTDGNADTILFMPGLGDVGTGIDVIAGFEISQDTVMFRTSSPLSLVIGSTLPDGTTGGAVLYDQATGVLSYDADGSGTGAILVTLATFTGAPDLTASNFQLVTDPGLPF
jgi:Ca2+-binding RTX toxin-like protein